MTGTPQFMYADGPLVVGGELVHRLRTPRPATAARRLLLTQDVPPAFPGGPQLFAGEVMFQYLGPTYGCLERGQIAVTGEPDEGEFYGVPADAVVEV